MVGACLWVSDACQETDFLHEISSGIAECIKNVADLIQLGISHRIHVCMVY